MRSIFEPRFPLGSFGVAPRPELGLSAFFHDFAIRLRRSSTAEEVARCLLALGDVTVDATDFADFYELSTPLAERLLSRAERAGLIAIYDATGSRPSICLTSLAAGLFQVKLSQYSTGWMPIKKRHREKAGRKFFYVGSMVNLSLDTLMDMSGEDDSWQPHEKGPLLELRDGITAFDRWYNGAGVREWSTAPDTHGDKEGIDAWSRRAKERRRLARKAGNVGGKPVSLLECLKQSFDANQVDPPCAGGDDERSQSSLCAERESDTVAKRQRRRLIIPSDRFDPGTW